MKKLKLLGIGQGKLIPSFRYRLEEVKKDFLENDIDIELCSFKISSYPPSNRLKRFTWVLKVLIDRFNFIKKQKKIDLIILQREMISTLYTLERFINKPFIFDLDDSIHLIQRLHSIDKIAKKASAVVVCNDFLASYYKQINKNVYILPTPVNTAKYKSSTVPHDSNKIIIGWIGTSTNFELLLSIENALSEILYENKNIFLKIVSNEKPKFTGIPQSQYMYKKWSEKDDVNDLQSFDIGIMPLLNDKDSQGKCAFKMLQYMSCSIPVVTSCLPMNKHILNISPCGYCANTINEWKKYILKLCEDKELRKNLGKNGREIIIKNYSTKIYAKKYKKIIEEIL